MAAKPDENGETDRRKFERTTVVWSGNLVCDGQDIDCLIVNVSPVGAMVRVEKPEMCKNKSVILRSPRFGELSGEITWRQGDELGVEFSDNEQVVAEKMDKALH